MQLCDTSGRPVILGREIARGGEGAILEVDHDPSLVAKVYLASVDVEKASKLVTMAHVATNDLVRIAAWPTNILHRGRDGQLAGILMPKIAKSKLIHQLYSPGQRKVYFPRADWSFLVHVAMNCAAAFDVVHHHGHVIGDVNHSGVMVSEQGTTCLVDCDSFQIRSNGRLFRCVVGVPEYTPPELQGGTLNVERTINEDCFGLALLIFHLLFMGRHPFAGTCQAGDRPIEQAISEGRFAFSHFAQKYQMFPPPYSLGLDCLPRPVGDLFERAFHLPQNGLSRPTATEWRDAMAMLKANLKTCAAHKGHRYSSHLTDCPWCEIMAQRGPNFFISVQIVIGGVVFELPHVDVRTLWMTIDAIVPPSAEHPTYPPRGNLQPTPLPEGVQDQLLMKKMAGGVALGACVLMLVGFAISPLTWIIGATLAAVFAGWWCVVALYSDLAKELLGRRENAHRKRTEIESAMRQWDQIAAHALSQFESNKGQLRRIAQELSNVRGAFDAEKRHVEEQRQGAQLENFLEGYFIRDAKISGIGYGRRATLCSYGVESAADIREEKLNDIPGIGAAAKAQLVAWREGIAKQFVFNPNIPFPTSVVQQVVIKYRQMQESYKTQLVVGAQELSALSKTANAQLLTIAQTIQSLVPQVRQAEVDAGVRTR